MRTFLFLVISLLITSTPEAATTHNYQEARVHNTKIEQRFVDWHQRAQAHAQTLAHSKHRIIKDWRDQLHSLNFTDELQALRLLNRFINEDVRYVDDFTHFHQKDFWDDPETTLEEGGDCEDIALLKAASLHLLDWPEERMHLLVGYLLERGKPESHAVLLIETASGDQYVLRSIENRVVLPDRFNFRPIFAVDSQGVLIVKQHTK